MPQSLHGKDEACDIQLGIWGQAGQSSEPTGVAAEILGHHTNAYSDGVLSIRVLEDKALPGSPWGAMDEVETPRRQHAVRTITGLCANC